MKYSMRRTLPCWPSGVRQERVQVDALLGERLVLEPAHRFTRSVKGGAGGVHDPVLPGEGGRLQLAVDVELAQQVLYMCPDRALRHLPVPGDAPGRPARRQQTENLPLTTRQGRQWQLLDAGVDAHRDHPP